MRYELADYEWVAIKPMLPNKSRGRFVSKADIVALHHQVYRYTP